MTSMQREFVYQGWKYTIDFRPFVGRELRKLNVMFTMAAAANHWTDAVVAEMNIHDECVSRIDLIQFEKTETKDAASVPLKMVTGEQVLNECEDNGFVVALVNEVRRPLSEDERKNFKAPRE